jgi:hypothetical protein
VDSHCLSEHGVVKTDDCTVVADIEQKEKSKPMFTLKLLLTSKGYRRVGIVLLGLLAVWRFGYLNRHSVDHDFMAMEDWLNWGFSSPNRLEEVAEYSLMCIAEIALLVAFTVAAVEIFFWIRSGFGYRANAPEPRPDLLIKALRMIRITVLTLFTLPVLLLAPFLLIEIINSRANRIDAGGWVFVAVVVAIWIAGMVIAQRMSRQISLLNGSADPEARRVESSLASGGPQMT